MNAQKWLKAPQETAQSEKCERKVYPSMPNLKDWRARHHILCDHSKRRDDIRKLWRFLTESKPGDTLEVGGNYQIVGDVTNFLGPNKDGLTGDGTKIENGDTVITSPVKSIVHLRDDDPHGLNFAIHTENSVYDVSADELQAEFAKEAKDITL